MTTLFQNTDTYDIELGSDGQIGVVSGKDAYANIIEDTVRTIQGEYIFDLDFGIPYFSTVLGGRMRISEWVAELQSAVNQLEFVTGIASFDYTYNAATKVLSYNMTVNTDLGTVEISQ